MRNIPVDLSALTFVCVSAPRPKLVNQETGEVKVNRDGNTMFTVGLSVADQMGRVELLNVTVPGDQSVTVGQIVTPVGLVAFPWEQFIAGEKRWGVAYRANTIITLTPPVAGSSAAADAA